jgi:hypothetical protein
VHHVPTYANDPAVESGFGEQRHTTLIRVLQFAHEMASALDDAEVIDARCGE